MDGSEENLYYHALVQDAGAVISNYIAGCFVCPEHSPDSFSVAIIACVNSRVLVAFSGESWAKQVSERKLPAKSLEKAICIRVPCCGQEDRDEVLEGISTNVWLGWLKGPYHKCINYEAGPDPSYSFVSRESGEKCTPYAQALVDAAYEKFGLKELLFPAPVESRMTAMEERFSFLESGLQELLALQRGEAFVSAQEDADEPASAPALRAPALKAPRVKSKVEKPSVTAPPGLESAFGYPGLDPSAVNAALQAGIPSSQLQKMSQLLAGKPTRLEDYPRQNL